MRDKENLRHERALTRLAALDERRDGKVEKIEKTKDQALPKDKAKAKGKAKAKEKAPRI